MSSGQVTDNLLTSCSTAFHNYLRRTGLAFGVSASATTPGMQQVQPSSQQRVRKPKVHDYSQYEEGIDFAFEVAHETSRCDQYYMTSDRRKAVQKGDYVTLQKGSQPKYYKVEQVDFYQDASDMWIALLSSAPQLA